MISELGSREQAWTVIRRMYAESKAYRQFLNERSPKLQGAPEHAELPLDFGWDDIPVITKSSFYSKYPFFDLLPSSNIPKIYGYTRSSGTTVASTPKKAASRGFFWPSIIEPIDDLNQGFADILKQVIATANQPTLFIVGLSLGSWAGGENIGFASKLSGLTRIMPITTFSPGNQHDEIVEIIDFSHEQYERIVIACCPSAIYYILKTAENAGVQLPLEKMSFMVTGEPFSEELRMELQRMAGPKRRTPVMYSVYGSADAGFSGMEGQHLINLRQSLHRNPKLAEKLGLRSGAIPTFFHMYSRAQYFENVNGELVVTSWQGLPLVRYNLEDRVQMFSWKEICAVMMAEAENDRQKKLWKFVADQQWPDVLAVYGRSKGCLFLCGTNVFDSMIEQVVMGSPLLDDKITGHFVVWVEQQGAQQQLHWAMEVNDPVAARDPFFQDRLYEEFCEALGKLQPEFKEDFNKLYSKASDRSERVFQFHFVEPGVIQNHPDYHSGIKRKIILNRSPLVELSH